MAKPQRAAFARPLPYPSDRAWIAGRIGGSIHAAKIAALDLDDAGSAGLAVITYPVVPPAMMKQANALLIWG
jgi:hypothetical protein